MEEPGIMWTLWQWQALQELLKRLDACYLVYLNVQDLPSLSHLAANGEREYLCSMWLLLSCNTMTEPWGEDNQVNYSNTNKTQSNNDCHIHGNMLETDSTFRFFCVMWVWPES